MKYIILYRMYRQAQSNDFKGGCIEVQLLLSFLLFKKENEFSVISSPTNAGKVPMSVARKLKRNFTVTTQHLSLVIQSNRALMKDFLISYFFFVMNFKRQKESFKHLHSCSDTSLLCQSAWPTLSGFSYLSAGLLSSNVEFSHHAPFFIKKISGLGVWILKMRVSSFTDLLNLGL